uniref:cytochrome P450 n=1 Tax=Rhizorhabdus sp. TaxID=1968843 RepID=UPI001B78ECDE
MATAFKQIEDEAIEAARSIAYSMPIEDIDMTDSARFVDNTHWAFFERLRKEAPVHYCANGRFGPFWSVTRYKDIMAVDTNHAVFSSEAHLGGITAKDQDDDFILPMFIAMDQPKHDMQRKAVSPIVAPANLAVLEVLIRERAQKIFDNLPINEPFDWVDRVSIELTTQMLATLFDFPWEDRRKLTYWSDVTTIDVSAPDAKMTRDEQRAILIECLTYFTGLWNQRVNAPPAGDLISMMVHNPSMRDMQPMEYLGNLVLLIVGGNDTTRNSITGGLLFLNENPGEYQKLREDHSLIESMVPEIIRYQTPLAHMRRTALQDTILG